MGIPRVSTGFCGLSLRTASLIIAWCFSILVGIVWSLYLSLMPALNAGYDGQRISERAFNSGITSIIGMILTYSIIVHCLLLWGVLKKQHYFFLPWIVITCLNIAISICVTVGSLIVILLGTPLAFIIFIPNSLISSCLVYCLLVIESYYYEIKDENSRTRNSSV